MQDGTLRTPGEVQETATLRGDVFSGDCPTRQLLDRIGDKWSVLILVRLGERDLRFSALKRLVGGISQKMLAATLRALERDGLVTREVEPTVPVTVTYGITPLGRDLLSALRMMIDWAETRMAEVRSAQKHFDGRRT
jgi:DNA-binding HxlR family transcriptional regulator